MCRCPGRPETSYLLEVDSLIHWLLGRWCCIMQADHYLPSCTAKSQRQHDCCFVCQALRERKRCVTAHWLNTVLKKKKLVPPHRALHFPVAFPPGGKPCSQHVRPAPSPAWLSTALPQTPGLLSTLSCVPWPP